MLYREWGAADNPAVLLCVHGLTRSGLDFDELAAALSGDYRVICPDVVGHGRSDWLTDKSAYQIHQYLADMVTLIAQLELGQVDWLGTSMGGVIGMVLAAQENTPIKRLILNDAGPLITAASLQRIGATLGKPPRFDSMDAAEQYLREVSAGFGPHTDAQWRRLTENVVRVAADGKIEFCYDPGLAHSYQAVAGDQGDIELWPFWDMITCPTLVLHGADSDLLRDDTVREMAARGPKAEVVDFAGVGHAPTLRQPEQIAALKDWLDSHGR